MVITITIQNLMFNGLLIGCPHCKGDNLLVKSKLLRYKMCSMTVGVLWCGCSKYPTSNQLLNLSCMLH